MSKFVLLILIALSSGVGSELRAADATHAHTPKKDGAGEPELNHGKKWGTDAPLRKGMNQIKQDLSSKHEEIHAHRLSGEGFTALADRILTSTQFIFKNCKLTPAADAQLHLILVPIVNAAQSMKTAADSRVREGAAADVSAALERYGRYFDHPGWSSK